MEINTEEYNKIIHIFMDEDAKKINSYPWAAVEEFGRLAFYMGRVIDNTVTDRFVFLRPTYNEYLRENPELSEVHFFNYHNSWDWLMPVVIKLQDIAGQYSMGKIPHLEGLDSYSDNIERCFVGTPDISEVHECVVDFILFLNKNNESSC